ncbi:MAG: hypothetical protein MJ194_01635 [Clostridia bacterium]|nr:hypothetical protein [Clostridia bacterium]
MSTVKLYQQDVYKKSGELCVERFGEDAKGRRFIVFKESFFFPEGGGQPCDLGIAGTMKVVDVLEDKATGDVLHYVDAFEDDLAEGTLLHCEIDWARRFDHMQMHCGEHILSGAFYRLFKAENKGFHMGDDYMTVDMLFPPEFDGDPRDAGEAAEYEANRTIWANVPIKTYYYETREEANALPSRKKIAFDEDISMVVVGDPEDPMDCCPCCGTHPGRSGEIGLVKVIKCEPNKEYYRYTLKSGRFALADYRFKHEIATMVGNRYSTSLDRLERAMDKAEAENNDVRRERSLLKKSLINAEVTKLKALIDAPCHKSYRSASYAIFSPDDLQSFAKDLDPVLKGVLILVSEKANTAVILSDGKVNAGKLVKENASIYRGKGGGSPKLARAIFDSKENLELYLDLIEKHLR